MHLPGGRPGPRRGSSLGDSGAGVSCARRCTGPGRTGARGPGCAAGCCGGGGASSFSARRAFFICFRSSLRPYCAHQSPALAACALLKILHMGGNGLESCFPYSLRHRRERLEHHPYQQPAHCCGFQQKAGHIVDSWF